MTKGLHPAEGRLLSKFSKHLFEKDENGCCTLAEIPVKIDNSCENPLYTYNCNPGTIEWLTRCLSNDGGATRVTGIIKVDNTTGTPVVTQYDISSGTPLEVSGYEIVDCDRNIKWETAICRVAITAGADFAVDDQVNITPCTDLDTGVVTYFIRNVTTGLLVTDSYATVIANSEPCSSETSAFNVECYKIIDDTTSGLPVGCKVKYHYARDCDGELDCEYWISEENAIITTPPLFTEVIACDENKDLCDEDTVLLTYNACTDLSGLTGPAKAKVRVTILPDFSVFGIEEGQPGYVTTDERCEFDRLSGANLLVSVDKCGNGIFLPYGDRACIEFDSLADLQNACITAGIDTVPLNAIIQYYV